jgi:hypothetical protein
MKEIIVVITAGISGKYWWGVLFAVFRPSLFVARFTQGRKKKNPYYNSLNYAHVTKILKNSNCVNRRETMCA